MNLIENGTATGEWVEWTGGTGLFEVSATDWNGATANPQFRTEQGEPVTMENDSGDVSFTENDGTLFRLPAGVSIRCFISGSPTGVYARALNVGV